MIIIRGPLVGERSVAGLARLIAKTMPEDAPGDCVGEDAEKVAAYIYESFYSKSAQARNKFQPPRIELSRLTVRQYKNAIADLLGSFQAPARWDDQRGLKAEYSSRSRRRRNGSSGGGSLNRVDPEIHLDFGTGSPIPEQDALKDIAKSWQKAPVLLVPLSVFSGFSQDFRANWQGSLLAPETGEYEFLVKTENATRLWVNDKVRPLIDALVKSGNDTEYRGSVYLLGGRVYPVAAGAISVQGKNLIDRAGVETSAAGLRGDSPAKPLANLGPRNVSSCRHRFRRTTGASAMSAARRFPRPGISPPRTRRSRSPLTSPPISRNWPAWGKTHLTASRSSANSAGDSPSEHFGGH